MRTAPVLDYVCVHENRLWGCHFGTQVNSFESVNEIYCSELGDFRKWGTGTAADKAWTASVGAFGKWTGCISHRGYVLFFKEDKILRVSGTKPANFQYAEISANGLQAGCERSMAVIDEVLYYKSRNGVYAYDGALPERISDKLGAVQFARTAAAGGLYGKYFICLDGVLYVYDTANGLWHKEDASAVRFLRGTAARCTGRPGMFWSVFPANRMKFSGMQKRKKRLTGMPRRATLDSPIQIKNISASLSFVWTPLRDRG